MKHMTTKLLTLMFALLLAAHSHARLRVVTSVPGLAALAKEVGGEHVEVESLARASQDPHFVDGRPSFIVRLNKADLLIYTGLGLERGWLPPLVVRARNAAIQKGAPGHLDASNIAGHLLDSEGKQADRRQGDVHPNGNPHYLYDPRRAARVARGIAKRLAELDPEHAESYRNRARAFNRRLAKKVAQWETLMARHRGKSLVGYHKSLAYLCNWLGLEQAGFVEPQPGISPSPKHLARLIRMMRQRAVGVVVSEPWYSKETSRVVAKKAKAQLVRLPGDVGARGTKSYAELMDRIISQLRRAYDEAER